MSQDRRQTTQRLPEEKSNTTEDSTVLRFRRMEQTANPIDTADPRVALGPPGTGSGSPGGEYGGSRKLAQRFELSPKSYSRAAFVELAPGHVMTPDLVRPG